jgi:hypothetical protein
MLAGHTPGYIPHSACSFADSLASAAEPQEDGEESPAQTQEGGEGAGDQLDEQMLDELLLDDDEQMSNLMTSFSDSPPLSPAASMASAPADNGHSDKEEMFSVSVSTMGKPPAAPAPAIAAQELPMGQSRIAAQKEALHASAASAHSAHSTHFNDSVTPSSLFYSSSENSLSQSRVTDRQCTPTRESYGHFANEAVSPLSPATDSTHSSPAASPVPTPVHFRNTSQPASVIHQPNMVSSRGASVSAVAASSSSSAPAADIISFNPTPTHHSILGLSASPDSSPMDFSQRAEPGADFYASLGLGEPMSTDLDYNTEFVTRTTYDASPAAGPSTFASCIGSPAMSGPHPSTGAGFGKLRRHDIISEQAQQTAVRTHLEVAGEPWESKLYGSPTAKFSSQRVEVIETNESSRHIVLNSGPVAAVASSGRAGEVSLSRPGLRRPGGASSIAAAGIVGGSISRIDREKAMPHMLAADVSAAPASNAAAVVVAVSVAAISPPVQELAKEEAAPVPMGSTSDAHASSGVEGSKGVFLSPVNIDIDAVCMEVLQELQADQSYSLSCNALPTGNDVAADADADADDDVSLTLGLNDFMNSNLPALTRPRTVERPRQSRAATPSTGSSGGWSLGTTAASRVPATGGRFCRDDDEDAPVYFDDSYARGSEGYASPQRASPQRYTARAHSTHTGAAHVASVAAPLEDSFASQNNTMTTVGIDEGCYADTAGDEGEVAQLCLTSRPWQLHSSKQQQQQPSARQKPSEDVKEIVLYGKVGFTTSISISFRNKRSRGTVLQARAILHRFEPADPAVAAAAPSDTFRAISDGSADSEGAMSLAPDDKITVAVEFAPFMEGVYSGVLKIRSKKKAFMLLLRGEAGPDDGSEAGCSRDWSLPDPELELEPEVPLAPAPRPYSRHCPLPATPSPPADSSPQQSDQHYDQHSNQQYDPSGELQRKSLSQWLRLRLDSDASLIAREKLKNTYDRARYLRLLSSRKSPDGKQSQNGQPGDSQLIDSMQSKLKSTPLQKQREYPAWERGVYFRKETVDFGTASAGSILRMKVELCNSTDKEVHLTIGDPMLPFIVLHNEVVIPAHSFVRIPVRFVPVYKGRFSSTLYGQMLDSADSVVTVQFTGEAI